MPKWRPKSPEFDIGQRVRVAWEPLTDASYRLAGTIVGILPPHHPYPEGQYIVEWDNDPESGPEYFSWSDLERLPN